MNKAKPPMNVSSQPTHHPPQPTAPAKHDQRRPAHSPTRLMAMDIIPPAATQRHRASHAPIRTARDEPAGVEPPSRARTAHAPLTARTIPLSSERYRAANPLWIAGTLVGAWWSSRFQYGHERPRSVVPTPERIHGAAGFDLPVAANDVGLLADERRPRWRGTICPWGFR